MPSDRWTIKNIDPRKQPATPKLNAAAGVDWNMPFTSIFENAWEVHNRTEVSTEQLSQMRRHNGQARALFNLVVLPIMSALNTATFVPDPLQEGGEEEAKFIEQVFTLPPQSGGMRVPFRTVVEQMLNAVVEGFSAFEIVYGPPPKNGPLKDKKYTIEKIAYRPSPTITFLLDDNGNFAGFRQRASNPRGSIDVKIDPDYAAYFTYGHAQRPYYGESMFLAAFSHYDKIVKLEYIGHLAAQASALGMRVGTLPRNATEKQKAAFLSALQQFAFAQAITVPEGYAVDVHKEGTPFPFIEWLNYHNSQMSKSVLANFFDENQGGSDGAAVKFSTQSDSYFMIMLNKIMDDIEDVINTQIIPKMVDWNFNSGKYPRFQFGALSDEKKAALLELFKTAMTAGQSYTATPEFLLEAEKQISEEHGLEIDYPKIEKEQEEARKQQQLLLEAQAALGGVNATGQLRGLTPTTPQEPAGKPGPDMDSVRTSKPSNPRTGTPTGRKTVDTEKQKAKLSNTKDAYEEGLEILRDLDREMNDSNDS